MFFDQFPSVIHKSSNPSWLRFSARRSPGETQQKVNKATRPSRLTTTTPSGPPNLAMRPDGPRDPVAGPDSGPEPPYPVRLSGPVIKGFGRGSKEVVISLPTYILPRHMDVQSDMVTDGDSWASRRPISPLRDWKSIPISRWGCTMELLRLIQPSSSIRRVRARPRPRRQGEQKRRFCPLC